MTTPRQFLESRKSAYMAVFDPSGARTQEVLDDLARFCRADRTTFHVDHRIHAELEGRREVYLRIFSHLNLSVDELIKLYGAINE